MNQVFKVSGKVRNYAWGGCHFIPELLKQSNDAQNPCAEYWLGAHLSAPSVAIDGEFNGKTIPEIIELGQTEVLGSKVMDVFGELPFLFKILDVKDMLSIQVHPSKSCAEDGYDAENDAGIPLDAPHRNYRDRNHKPELMLALSDFWLLHGFKSRDSIRAFLETRECYQPMIEVLDQSDVKGLFEWALSEVDITKSVSEPLLRELKAEDPTEKLSPEYWILKWTRNPEATHRGLLVILLMNVVNIPKGEAIFQGAGIIHAYLEGQNIEIMANSDNVLRGGLTEKHMDFQELVKHTRFETIDPDHSMVPGTPLNAFERAFKAPIQDFLLSEINLSQSDATTCVSDGLEIFLMMEGAAEVISGDGTSVSIQKGEAFVATFGTELNIKTDQPLARIFRAKTNL